MQLHSDMMLLHLEGAHTTWSGVKWLLEPFRTIPSGPQPSKGASPRGIPGGGARRTTAPGAGLEAEE